MSLAKKYVTVPDYVMARDVGDEIVLLNLDTEQYYGLDEIGAQMWQIMTTSDDLQTALDRLYAKFDTELETLRRDLEDMVDHLVLEKLLLVHER